MVSSCSLLHFSVYAAENPATRNLEKVTLQLKWRHQFQFAGYYAAQSQGFYQQEGLNVNILEGGKDKSAVEMVSTGKAQYGVSDSEILLDYAHGKPIILMGAIFQHSPYVLLSRQDSKILSPADLVGKRVMLGDNQGATQFKVILKHEGINLNKITILPHSWNSQDLIDRKVDAISAYISAEPNYLRAHGIKPLILNSINYGVDFYGDTLFTSKVEAQQHTQRVEAFFRATQKGWEYALEHKEQLAEQIMTMPGVVERGITREILLNEARDMEPLILPNIVEIGHTNPGRWQYIADELSSLKLVDKPINLRGFFFEPDSNMPLPMRQSILVSITLFALILLATASWLFTTRRKLRSNSQQLQTEVSRRKLIESDLLAAETRINEMFHATAAGIAITTPDGRYLSANPAYSKMLNYTEAELQKTNFFELTSQNDVDECANKINQLLKGAISNFVLEKRYITKDGAIVWARASINPMYSATGEIRNFIAVTEDITEKILIENRLKDSESLLKMAGTLSHLGGWEVDAASMQMQWSDEVALMHELPAGTTPTIEEGVSMIAPEYRNIVQNALKNCINNGTPYDIEFVKLTANHRRIWVRSLAVALRDANGKIIRIQGAFQEITKQKQLQIFNERQSLILANIASGAPLKTVLDECIGLVESQYPELSCGISAVDDRQTCLRVLASSESISKAYTKAIEGGLIGKAAGSCGTAAYLKEPVIVSDIATDPHWKDYKELAFKHNLYACWSWPVFSSTGEVIGTFAAYSNEVATPTNEVTEFILAVVKTVGIAMEKENSASQIYLLGYALSRLNEIVIITEASPIDEPGPLVVYVNDAFEKQMGYRREDIINKSPRFLQGKKTQRSELDRIRTALEKKESVRVEIINYKKSGEEIWLEMEIVPILDLQGVHTHSVAIERDITSRKESEIELLRLNRALRLLSSCSDLLIRANDEAQLIKEVCELAVKIGGYRMAWVGYALDDENKSIIPMGSYGSGSDFLDELKLSWSEESSRGLGPGGKSIRGGKTIVVEDIANDLSYPATNQAIKQGYLGLISLPLKAKNRSFGLLAMYAPEVRVIPPEEIKLLEEMAEDLSFGIMNIRAMQEQERIQTALRKVASSVSVTASNLFFEQLVQSMVAATNADAGFIAKIISEEPLVARTVAAEVGGVPIENIEYDLNSSPCSNVLHNDDFVLSESQDCSNLSQTMIKLGMKDYIGQRLLNSQGKAIGMLFVMRKEPILHNDFAVSTLKIFATRVAAEMERQDYDRNMRNQASLLDKAQDAIIVRGMDHCIQFWNKGAERLYGWTQDEVLGKSILDLIYSGTDDFIEAQNTLLETGEWKNEVAQHCKDGRAIFVEVHWTLVRDDNGLPLSVLCINTDMTQRKAATEEIQYLAFYDSLTKLPNRQLVQDRIQHAIATSLRTGKHSALLFIDIDNFKTINDTMGHGAGDILLKQIAKRLLESTRDSDTVARLGGDEFIIMLEELSADAEEAAIQCKTFAEKLMLLFQDGFVVESHTYFSTPSIGITLFQDDAQTVSGLLQQADLAMYQAKASGRNTLRFYDPQMQIAVTRRAQFEDDLRAGLKKGEFLLYYQPQFDVHGYCVGVEALLRWKHQTKGMISPAEFIPLAEETLLILPIGAWVLKTACDTLVKWQKIPQMAKVSLAVNVSVCQFRQLDFVEQFTAIIESSGINPALLKLELTESLFAENTQDIISKMTALKKLGVVFSLDDFGTGYSSLSYLKRLPLDQLKIDQSFVKEVLLNQHDATICRSIINLAKSLGLEVIAEGVELLEQKEFLMAEGCYLYQGYYFSRPLPIDDLETLITKEP